MPDFLEYYKNLSEEQKRKLISEYAHDTGHSESTWFRKNNPKNIKQLWTPLEMKWLESKTGISKEELFPSQYKT